MPPNRWITPFKALMPSWGMAAAWAAFPWKMYR